ncbi:MAG: hypothetical protein RR205_04510, partial [Oscillospiraceae bacterium]
DNTIAIELFCKDNQIPFAGKIPYDKNVSTAINSGCSIAKTDCPARTSLLEVFNQTMLLINCDTLNNYSLGGK